MGNVYVRNGMPIGTVSLCDTCSSAHIVGGYRESEIIILCTHVYEQPLRIPFRVKSCLNHQDRTRPSYAQMQKLAMTITTGTLKPVGFLVTREEERKPDDED